MPETVEVDIKKEEIPLSSPSVSLGNSLLMSLSAGSTSSESSSLKNAEVPTEKKQAKKPRRKWKKPIGKPKRPLSAYNLYFKAERGRMLKKGIKKKLGFRDMAKLIGAKWNTLGPRARVSYEKTATEERKKYFAALSVWKREQQQKAQNEQKSFDRQMEMFCETIATECTDTDDIQEPLPIVHQVTPVNDLNNAMYSSSMSALDSNKSNNDFLASSLQMASDLSTEIFNKMDYHLESGLFNEFPKHNPETVPSSCYPDDVSPQSPAMQRILNTFKGLESSIDEEFLDFMSTLDFNGTPVAKNQQGRRI